VFQSPSHRGVARDANSRKTTCRLRRFQSPSHRGVARDVGGFSLWKRSTNCFSPLHIGESRATRQWRAAAGDARVSVPFTSGSRARLASPSILPFLLMAFQSPSHRGVARDKHLTTREFQRLCVSVPFTSGSRARRVQIPMPR